MDFHPTCFLPVRPTEFTNPMFFHIVCLSYEHQIIMEFCEAGSVSDIMRIREKTVRKHSVRHPFSLNKCSIHLINCSSVEIVPAIITDAPCNKSHVVQRNEMTVLVSTTHSYERLRHGVGCWLPRHPRHTGARRHTSVFHCSSCLFPLAATLPNDLSLLPSRLSMMHCTASVSQMTDVESATILHGALKGQCKRTAVVLRDDWCALLYDC